MRATRWVHKTYTAGKSENNLEDYLRRNTHAQLSKLLLLRFPLPLRTYQSLIGFFACNQTVHHKPGSQLCTHGALVEVELQMGFVEA